MTMHGQWFDALDHETQADYAEPPPPTRRERLATLLAQLAADHAREPQHYADPARIAAAVDVLDEGSIIPVGTLIWAVRGPDGRRFTVTAAPRGCSCGASGLTVPCVHLTALDLLEYLAWSDAAGA